MGGYCAGWLWIWVLILAQCYISWSVITTNYYHELCQPSFQLIVNCNQLILNHSDFEFWIWLDPQPTAASEYCVESGLEHLINHFHYGHLDNHGHYCSGLHHSAGASQGMFPHINLFAGSRWLSLPSLIPQCSLSNPAGPCGGPLHCLVICSQVKVWSPKWF